MRVAVVTGAAGGIGRAIAEQFIDAGLGVVLGDVDTTGCEQAAAELNARPGTGRAVAVPLDVSQEAAWAAAVRTARRRFGPPTVLVNNAGVLCTEGLAEVSEQHWSTAVDVMQRGTWLGMRALVPSMRNAGGGAIVNVASVFGRRASGGAFAYHAAKGSVCAMTRAAALELAPMGIRVNAVLPGLVETPMAARLGPDYIDGFVARTPLGRQGRPQEVATAVAFLASAAASFITGADLVVDGGYSAH